MVRSTPAQRTNAVLIGIFVAALLTHAWFATRNWTSPFMPGHEFRQTQTALISDYIDRQNNFSLLYETPLVGKPWVSILMEVPIYEWAVVGLSRATGWPHYVSARTITLGCFYLTLPAIFLLLGRVGLPPTRRALALALIVTCPVYIFYSRAFLMDSMTLCGSAWFLFGYIRMMDERRWYWFLLASLAGALSALVKSATLAIWLFPAAAYAAWQLWRDWRSRAGGGALVQTAFWGLAGVVIPLGLLRLWVLLTDPIKLAHSSAYLFASGNLVGGNWGLQDLHARFSPQVWGILTDRWSDAIMSPWLLLTLLVAGLIFLPKARGLALLAASTFFLAQLLFPYAYAYQDYYFYSCALFLNVGLACLFFGLLDSRAPRWLCWLLLAVPVFAQLKTYHRSYYSAQMAQTNGGFPFTRALRDFLPKEAVLVVGGGDWAAIIPYYSQRKALMIRNGLAYDSAYLDRAFADLFEEDVGALVLQGVERSNPVLIERAALAFGTDRKPSFSSDEVDVHLNLVYRDRFKRQLADAGNYDGLKNGAVEAAPGSWTRPSRVSASAKESFPGVSPAPIRAYFKFGLGYVWVDHEKAIFAHPSTDVWIKPPTGATQVAWDFGLVDEAYTGKDGATDGVEFTMTSIKPGAERRVVYQRKLDPARQAEDRGRQRVVLAYRPEPGEFLCFSTASGPSESFDWAYWAKLEVK